jgi:hypothetical protein
MTEESCVVLVPCKIGVDGKYETDGLVPPYGYHHILRFFPKSRVFYIVCHVSADCPQELAEEVSRLIAERKGLGEVKVFPEFYDENYYKFLK